MTKSEFLRVSLTRKEKTWGWRYLLFQTVFLPVLLNSIVWLLPFSLTSAQLNFLFFSINFCAALLIFHRYLTQFLHTGRKYLLRISAVSVIFFAVYWAANALLSGLLIAVDPDFANYNDQSIADMSQDNYWLMALGTVIFVPIAEECFHRGLLFRGLYDRSPAAAYLISVAAFSAVHVIGYADALEPLSLFLCFLQYVPAGVCLAAAYRLSGSLLSPILIHAAVNAVSMLALR